MSENYKCTKQSVWSKKTITRTKITLSQECITEISWWIQQLEVWNGKQIITQEPDLVIETDASTMGWGFNCLFPQVKMGGPWSPIEKKLHINALELKAASIAVKSMTKSKEKIHIHLKMDNVTAVTYVNKMGGTKSPILTEIAKDLWEYCLAKKITLTAEHLPGFLNQTADWESRNVSTISTNSWRLNPQIFKQIDLQWGPLEMDLFADRLNAQTEKYMSWKPDPFAVGTDAFLANWEGMKAYAFPPFCLIQRCVAKVQKEKGELVIVTPTWQTQPYYAMLLNMSIADPILLPPQRNLLLSQGGEPHPLIINGTLKLVAWRISGEIKKCKAYQKTLQNYSQHLGERELNQLTTAAGNTGLAGVTADKLIPFSPLWKI